MQCWDSFGRLLYSNGKVYDMGIITSEYLRNTKARQRRGQEKTKTETSLGGYELQTDCTQILVIRDVDKGPLDSGDVSSLEKRC
mmetsp:Transcript_9809/g.16091  ORF Transcript_9809/g.16091 Transcript_9809/m.16091 type:complete len:84 (+) Transcript_9809:1122-1373(+)